MTAHNFTLLARHTGDMMVEYHHQDLYETAFRVIVIVGLIIIIGLLMKLSREHKDMR